MPPKREGAHKPEPESFSPTNAFLAAEDMFKALPKSRQAEYLWNLNEVAVVLDALCKKAGITDKNKKVA